jgi:chorismate dehydratase
VWLSGYHACVTTIAAAPVAAPPARDDLRMRPVRLGVVSFINTLPLIDGLANLADIDLRHSVPSLLLDQLLAGETDVALCSTIDYQRSPEPLIMLPVGLLGCDGPTLTVRLYSSKPLEQVRRVYCDTDSHTSVALLRILLKEVHRIEPKLVDYDAREHVAGNRPMEWPEAMLLIGDKVVTDSPPAVRYPYQMDLGDEWARHTGLPFVFAAWMARAETEPALLRLAAMTLDHQRRHNRERIDFIIHHRARPRHWPVDLAADYLKKHIAHEWTEARRAGLDLFFDKALAHGLIAQRRDVAMFQTERHGTQ